MSLAPDTVINGYIFIRKLGSGAFASVWLAKHQITKLEVAIKAIERASIKTKDMKTRFEREISLLKKMHHPFIIEFIDAFDNDEYHFIAMEYAENGSILEYVNSKCGLAEAHARIYFSELIFALEYLHLDQFIAHRDLKSENVLLDRYNNIRIIDFGLSNQFSETQPNLKTKCGSPAYAAPEMIKGQPYTRAADIWSAGVLLYSMVSGKLPYEDDQVQRLLQKIVYTDVHYPPAMSPTLVDLLKKMLVKSPEQRITLDKIKAHPWFSQTEYATLIQDYFGQSIFSDNIVEGSIDKEIVDKMTNLGIDCRKLHQQILINEYTEITAIYRMLANDKLKEKMRALMDLFQKQDNKKKHTNNSQFAIMNRNVHAQPQATNGNVNPGFNLNFNKIQNLPIQTIYQGNTNCIHPCFNCTLSSRTKIPNSQNNNVNNNNNVKGPRKLMVPAPVKIAERRLSRPVAVNRMVDFLDKSNAYESP